jgi:hypothetical protein
MCQRGIPVEHAADLARRLSQWLAACGDDACRVDLACRGGEVERCDDTALPVSHGLCKRDGAAFDRVGGVARNDPTPSPATSDVNLVNGVSMAEKTSRTAPTYSGDLGSPRIACQPAASVDCVNDASSTPMELTVGRSTTLRESTCFTMQLFFWSLR